jgi:NAD(P)-dependent dehydrogenase (short-subunit alcohol dehydrogenase family)
MQHRSTTMTGTTLITGAAGGIGSAIARRLAETPGARLALVGRSEERLQPIIDEVRARGAEALPIAVDLGTAEGPAEAVDQAVDHFGGLQSVVSNAGVMGRTSLTETTVEEFDEHFAVNTRASWLLAGAAREHLAAAGGSVVAIASMAASHPSPFGAYSASKAALLMIVEQLAREWGPDGVRVNAVSPGMVMTPMSPAAHDDDLRRSREASIPLRRMAEPDDVAAAVQFLLSDAAAYITGENLAVDGGVRARFIPAVIGLG